jgi:hypothetical protein
MNITITVDADLVNAIQALASALSNAKPAVIITGGTNTKAEEALVMVGAAYDALEATVQEKKDQITPPTTTPEPQVTPAEQAPPKAPAITLEQVRARLATLTQAGKQLQVKALLALFGAKKLTDVPADKYAELLKEAEAI